MTTLITSILLTTLELRESRSEEGHLQIVANGSQEARPTFGLTEHLVAYIHGYQHHTL